MKFLKTALSLILVFSMVMSMSSIGAYAEESSESSYVPTNPYVLNYSSDNVIEGYEDFDVPRFYYSPYRINIKVWNDRTDRIQTWDWCTASVLNMINTSKIGTVANPTGPYASIPVYCVDAFTDGVKGYEYRRVNLEDSKYFSDVVSGRVRAIYMNSFPYIDDMSAITQAVNEWIASDEERSNTYAPVQELNHYEVISATQGVIWTITNGSPKGGTGFFGLAPYLGTDDIKGFVGYGEDVDETWYAANCIYNLKGNPRPGASADEDYSQGTSEYTANNILAVARYLESLAPMSPRDTVISEAAFGAADVSYVQETDGTYTAVIEAEVSAEIDDATDNLTLTAVSADLVSEPVDVVNGTNTYELTIRGMAAPAEIVLNIDGVQCAADVFLFDPLNGRDASQTMAGYDSSALPVHAETDPIIPTFILPETGGISVNGVKVWNDSNDKDQIRPESIEVELYADGVKFLTQTVTAGKDGSWSFSFNNLPAVNENQTEIVYTVKEAAVDGYTSEVTGDVGNGFVITNSHTPAPPQIPETPVYPEVEYTSVSVSKVWEGDTAETRPAEITVQLLRDGKPFGTAVKLNDGNQWTHVWNYLIEGYSYSVQEIDVPEGYTSVVAGSDTSYVITNTVIPEDPKEDPVITPEDPDTPAGGMEVDDPLFGLDEDGIPRDYLDIGDPDVPKTADETNMNIWMLIAFLSGMVLAVSAVSERRQKKHNA